LGRLIGGREEDAPGGRWVDGEAEKVSDRRIANHLCKTDE